MSLAEMDANARRTIRTPRYNYEIVDTPREYNWEEDDPEESDAAEKSA